MALKFSLHIAYVLMSSFGTVQMNVIWTEKERKHNTWGTSVLDIGNKWVSIIKTDCASRGFENIR